MTSEDATRRPLLCLTGPTASGKSAAAMALARHLPIEIVSVDSAQVYRGMDVGTAKPSVEDRTTVPHHLIDLIDPAEAYSAARFVVDAEAAIATIEARGHVPLLVGGTMLYFKALRDGLDDLPVADLALRADIEREAAAAGWDAMHRRLAEVDPDMAARLAPLDAQRISRALEVWRSTGRTLSSLQGGGTVRPRRRPSIAWSLEPSDRGALHRRVAARFDAMLDTGLVDEVKSLYDRGDLHERMPSMRCVGYRQVWDLLEGRSDAKTMREAGIAATRQLAKRQMTWLRSMPDRVVVDCLADDAANLVVEQVLRHHHG